MLWSYLGIRTATSMVPNPSWPPSPAPQANTWPCSFTATEWARPHETSVIFWVSKAPTSSSERKKSFTTSKEMVTGRPFKLDNTFCTRSMWSCCWQLKIKKVRTQTCIESWIKCIISTNQTCSAVIQWCLICDTMSNGTNTVNQDYTVFTYSW